MYTITQRNWPSATANGISLTDPVAVSFNGDVVLLAREKGVAANKLYYNVRHDDPDALADDMEYSGWYELDMSLAESTEPGGTATSVGLRVLGAGLISVPSSAQSAQPGDAPFAALSDDRYIYIFRPSHEGTLYLDRFILIQVPAPQEDNNRVRRDAGSTKPTRYQLERIWELCYRGSGKKDTPADERDVLGYRDMMGDPFIEPTMELVEVPRSTDGRFAIALLPTSDVDKYRWCHFVVDKTQIQVTSWPQSTDGLFDFLPTFWSDPPPSSFSILPQYVGGQALTCEAGIAMRVYAEQDPAMDKDGARLRRALRLMVTVPVSATDIGLTRAMAVYDFNILPSGYLPVPSSPLKSALLDGELANGKFTPTTPLPASFPVTESAVTLADNSTIYAYLLGSVQPAATPFVLDGGDGLVHCYYGGQDTADEHPFMVAQYSPEVQRSVVHLEWNAGDQPGTLDLVGQRPGTSLNSIKINLADTAGTNRADLCNMTVDYGGSSGIGPESWLGLSRDLGGMIDVLNGKASGELLAREVQDGSARYFDYAGIRTQARLPLVNADQPVVNASQPTGWLTLVSTRLDLALADVNVSAGTKGEKVNQVTLVLSFHQGSNSITQTWEDVSDSATDLRTVLRGDDTSFSYGPSSSDPWVLGLTAAGGTATMLFFASSSAVLSETSITITAGSSPDKINFQLKSGVLDKTCSDLPANSAELAVALLAIPEVTAVFPVISANDNSGPVPPQLSLQPLNLRTLSSLFGTLPPTAEAPLTACSVSATVIEGHSQGSPQTMTPLVNRLVALSAVSTPFPSNGIPAVLSNQIVAATPAPSNGAWVAAKPLNALSLPGDTAMTVPTGDPNFDVMAPGKTFTMETWLRPDGGKASRVFSFNGTQSGNTKAWEVAPSFFLSVFAQPALQFKLDTSGGSNPSYISIPVDNVFTPDYAFTWEIWVKAASPVSPQGLRGSLLQVLYPMSPSPCAMEIALDSTLKPVLTSFNGSDNVSQTADTSLQADVWTHIAVTGEIVDSVKHDWRVSVYVNGMDTSIKDADLKMVWNNFGSNVNQLIIGGLGKPNSPTAAAALAEVRYWQIRRTRSDIQDSMYYTLAGTEPGLAGYWPLSDDIAYGATISNSCWFGGNGTGPNKNLNGTLTTTTPQPVVPDCDGAFLAMAAGVGGAPALRANAFLRSTHWNHVAVSYQAGSAVHLNSANHDLVRCGHDRSLNLSDAFSIEAWIQVEASDQPLPQTFVAKWGKDASEQSYWFGLNDQGQLNLQAQYEYKVGSQDKTLQLVNASSDGEPSLRDGKPHHVAATVQTATNTDQKEPYQTTLEITVVLYVDGNPVKMRNAATRLPPITETAKSVYVANVQATTVDLTLGAAVQTATGVAGHTAPEAQMYLTGMLTGVVLWSRAMDGKEIVTSIQNRVAAQRDGAVAAWWFGEQAGLDAVDSIGGLVAKLSSNDLWAVYNQLSELLFYSNGHQLLSIKSLTDASTPNTNQPPSCPIPSAKGYLDGTAQFTLGGYQNGTVLEDSLLSQLNDVRLWQQVRSQRQIAEMRFTRLVGDEPGLIAYWNFDDTELPARKSRLDDQSPFGNDGVMWQNKEAAFVLSAAPVSNEGPVVRNVYGGQPTEFQQRLKGKPGAIEFSEVSRIPTSPLNAEPKDGQAPKLVGSLSRAYYYTSGTVNLTSGFYAGALRLVYLGQVQTDATLIGFIEGAPPVPSENLTRPYYTSPVGYFSYFNASSITLSDTEATTLSYNTSYSHGGTLDHTTSGGLKYITEVSVELPGEGLVGGPVTKVTKTDLKIGPKEKGGFVEQDVSIENSSSSWTVVMTDALSLRGNWESSESILNPQVGRRFQPDNVGYALVSSLTADVYLTYNAATGAAVGRAVVPNPDIPLDNNVLTFQIDNRYIKNGTLDGKVGLYNDPDYPAANLVRGSYFKPAEAYRLKRQIARNAVDDERYWNQFNAHQRAIGSDTSLSDQKSYRLVERTSKGVIARRGMANTYVWTASGGLHAEQEQFTDQYTTTFTGGYTVNNQFGIVTDLWATVGAGGPLIGGFFTLDWMAGFKIDISVTKTRTMASAFGLNVAVTGEPALLTWDEKGGKDGKGQYSANPTPGKVASYRFNTFYLPPDTDNGNVLMDTVVDSNWLRSNDPDAVTLRSARVGNPAWRVLYRVTYVNRIPPGLDNTPNQTLPAPILHIVDLENNEVLVALILQELGASPPTPENVGTSLATVINPPSKGGTFPPSKLGLLVPWWDDFLATTRGKTRDESNFKLLQGMQFDILQYVLTGSAQGDGPMSDCKSFSGVNQAIFDCVKQTSHAEHGTLYDPPNADSGTATTDTPVGKVVLSFDLDTSAQTIKYCIVSKPWIVSASTIFDGILKSIKGCQQKK